MKTLTPNWFLTHTPAPGSQRPYKPLTFKDLEETPPTLKSLSEVPFRLGNDDERDEP
jgi:hypothetical protein